MFCAVWDCFAGMDSGCLNAFVHLEFFFFFILARFERYGCCLFNRILLEICGFMKGFLLLILFKVYIHVIGTKTDTCIGHL